MNGEIIISDEFMGYNYFFDTMENLFSIEVYVPKNKTLESVLSNKELFLKSINIKLREEKLMGFSDEEEIKVIETLRDNYENLWNYIEYVKLYNLHSSIKEMIDRNPLILSKKIVLKEAYSISDYNTLMDIFNNNCDIADRIYVSFYGNNKLISLIDAIITIEEIQKQIGYVKSLDLSQMETIMYIYDYVRKRIYTFEDKEDEINESRDLTNVLFGDKIVCMGYTNLFNSMLEYLGISAEPVFYDGLEIDNNKNDGHVRTMINVNDSKYDIQGLFLFDPTWDSKRSKNNNDYLSSYKFFAKNVKYMEKYDIYAGLDDNKFIKYYNDDYYLPLKLALKSGDREEIEKYISGLNHFARRIIGTDLINPLYVFNGKISNKMQETILQNFLMICSCFIKEISAEKMILIANNVRKVEYYKKHEYYPYNVEELYETTVRSNWEFTKIHLTPNEKFIKAVFKKLDTSKRTFAHDFVGYIKEKNIEFDIGGTHLAKALRLVLDKKKED